MEKQVGLMSYRLKLLLSMKKLYLVFSIVKLTTVFEDLILDQCALFLLDSVIVNNKPINIIPCRYVKLLPAR